MVAGVELGPVVPVVNAYVLGACAMEVNTIDANSVSMVTLCHHDVCRGDLVGVRSPIMGWGVVVLGGWVFKA